MASWSKESIQNAERKVTGAADCREDMHLVTASHLNCQSMLTSAPMIVAVMGHLTMLTIHNDDDLRREGGYKYIKYPESVRASTVHLANEACSAFSLAQKNMDQIRIYTGQIPGHVQSAVKILLQGTEHEIAKVMPNYLTLLENTADKCVNKSKEVEDAFLFVEYLTMELQEACIIAQVKQESKLKDGKEFIKKKKVEIKAAASEEERIQKEREMMKKQIEEAKKKYDEQMKNMPGAAKLIGMGIADGLCKLLSSPGNLVSGLFSLGSTAQESLSEDVLETALELVKIATKHLQAFLEQGAGEGNLDDLKSTFEKELSKIQSHSGPERNYLNRLYKTALDVTSNLMDPQARSDKARVESELKWLQGMTEVVEIFSKTLHGSMPISGSGPKMSKVESTGLFDEYVKQIYIKMESAEAALKAAKKDFKQMTEKWEKEKERNVSLMTEMATVDMNKIEYGEIKEFMRKCLYAVAQVREQWGRLVRFFTTLSNIVHSALHDSLRLFTKTMELERDTALPYGFSDAMIDIIYQQTAEANKIAFMTSDLSELYLTISQEHLTDPLARLGKLLALDPKKDKQLIKDKQKELTWQCESATRAVGNFIARKKEEFDSRIDARIQKIDRELRAVLPPKVEDSPEIKRMKEQSVAEAEELKRKRQKEMDHFC